MYFLGGRFVPPVITIQPLVPERLPCYDFRPVARYPSKSEDNFWCNLLPARDRQLVDLEALISPRRADSRLLAIPNS